MGIVPAITDKIQKLLNALELQFLVLASLFLQVVLITTGSRRKYSRNKWLTAVLWLSYLSADSVATLALGIISKPEGDSKNALDPKYMIYVFWAPFLLMHLGGPDTITAYALADNELWSRHLLGFVGQVSVALYVFILSFTGTGLNIVWIVVFVAGSVKYGERSGVLFSASKDRFRDSMVSGPDPGPNYAKLMGELVSREEEGYEVSLGKAVQDSISSTSPEYKVSLGKAVDSISSTSPESDAEKGSKEISLLQKAYTWFGTFRKLFADLILSFQDRKGSVSYFKQLDWKEAFTIVEIELGLVFDLFYTKSSFIFTSWGVILRIVSCLCTVGALVGFHIIKKNGYPRTEVIITYCLLAGAIFLEFYAILMLFLSDRMMIWLGWDWRLRLEKRFPKLVSLLRYLRFVVPARNRWSNSAGQFNVLISCLNYMPERRKVNRLPYKLDQCRQKIDQYLDEFDQILGKYLFWRPEPVPSDLKEKIFEKLKDRATKDGPKIESNWKDKILLEEMSRFKEHDNVEFDESVLIWQIATDICYAKVEKLGLEHVKTVTDRCRFVSDYMVHLLMVSPFMLPSGIGQIRIQDTCAEAKEFLKFEVKMNKHKACIMLSDVESRYIPSEVKGDRSKSVLFDACRLAEDLRVLDHVPRWEKISDAWLDMLMFAAAQCSWSDHAEKLSQGGELLTHVWLLMAHFGLTDQFQISKGYIRAKLELK